MNCYFNAAVFIINFIKYLATYLEYMYLLCHTANNTNIFCRHDMPEGVCQLHSNCNNIITVTTSDCGGVNYYVCYR